jgi:hypothetical protein
MHRICAFANDESQLSGVEIEDCSIGVFRNRQGNRSINYHIIKTAKERGRRFAVVVLGDEIYNCAGARVGGSEFAPTVIRNYW